MKERKTKTDNINKINDLKRHASILLVPVFKQMKVDRDPDETIVFNANSGSYLEQFICCGPCQKETFDECNKKDLEKVKKANEAAGCINVKESIHFYKTYSSGLFDYDIYVTDIVMPSKDETRYARILYAFFHEPRLNDRYVITFGKMGVDLEDRSIRFFQIDEENDAVLKECEDYLKAILDDVKYKQS